MCVFRSASVVRVFRSVTVVCVREVRVLYTLCVVAARFLCCFRCVCWRRVL